MRGRAAAPGRAAASTRSSRGGLLTVSAPPATLVLFLPRGPPAGPRWRGDAARSCEREDLTHDGPVPRGHRRRGLAGAHALAVADRRAAPARRTPAARRRDHRRRGHDQRLGPPPRHRRPRPAAPDRVDEPRHPPRGRRASARHTLAGGGRGVHRHRDGGRLHPGADRGARLHAGAGGHRRVPGGRGCQGPPTAPEPGMEGRVGARHPGRGVGDRPQRRAVVDPRLRGRRRERAHPRRRPHQQRGGPALAAQPGAPHTPVVVAVLRTVPASLLGRTGSWREWALVSVVTAFTVVRAVRLVPLAARGVAALF